MIESLIKKHIRAWTPFVFGCGMLTTALFFGITKIPLPNVGIAFTENVWLLFIVVFGLLLTLYGAWAAVSTSRELTGYISSSSEHESGEENKANTPNSLTANQSQ